MFHTVHVPNNHASATDNIFLDLSRLHAYVVLPSSHGLSDQNAQCVTLNKCFVKTNTNLNQDQMQKKLLDIVKDCYLVKSGKICIFTMMLKVFSMTF
jgi:hypothetical protein